MRNHEMNIDGKKISYFEWGSKENPTIVCIHGVAGNAVYSFAELADYLGQDFHLLVFDNPGHGNSDPFEKEEEYLFSYIANWFDRVFLQVFQGPFYLLGHSWGADITLHYTRHFPSRVKGIILLDGGFTFPQNKREMTFEETYKGWKEYMDSSKYASWEDVVSEYSLYTKRWDEKKAKYTSSIFKKNTLGEYELITSKKTALAIIKAFFNESFVDTYAYIRVPVLLIHATLPTDLDTARKIGISQLRNNITDVTVVPLEDASHMVQWDEPEIVTRVIKEWAISKMKAAVHNISDKNIKSGTTSHDGKRYEAL